MKRLLVCLFTALVALSLAGCRQSYEWNQKLTLVVETPHGEVSGSAVVNEKVWFGQQPLSGNQVAYELAGEAATVEVSPGRFLFALHSDLKTLALASTLWRNFPQEAADIVLARIEKSRDIRPVPPNMYPTLVTFTDPANPKSGKLVDPANLAAAFGSGYRVKSITLEITDEKVTEGRVEKLLGWLDDRDSIVDFWKSFMASGFQPSGSTEVKILFIVRG